MPRHCKKSVLAVCTAIALIGSPVAHALAATQLEQAELAGLSPEMRAQVQARAVGGNSVTEVLQVMLLNNIKIKHEASLIAAIDWTRSVAVVQLPNGSLILQLRFVMRPAMRGAPFPMASPGHGLVAAPP
jgi:hypothetical protein